ncbi:MAG: DNA ligase [Pirellulales bacterium]
MADIPNGGSVEIQGSAARPYVLKNIGGVYSCSCPAWRNQSLAIERRTCKHLRSYRGEAAESSRLGALPAAAPTKSTRSRAPALLLAQNWSGDVDLADWWLSEKLDGVRAYWDGRRFLSRQGNRFHAPNWFVQGFPSQPLDGELWIGRRRFQRTVSIVRRQDHSDLWRELRYLVFDAPAVAGPFEARLEFARQSLAQKQPLFAKVLEQQRCQGVDHLQRELARIELLGGEGLMLREPGSHYVAGRSTSLLKVKTFHDAEARVIGHQPGNGRHQGRLGALLVELADGTQFAVGTGFTDRQREQPPAIGSLITFRYQELTDGGVPRFPSFVRAVEPEAAATVK